MKPRPREYLDDMLFRVLFIAALIMGLWAITRLVVGGEPRLAACPALDSPRHAALNRLAQNHAEYMARTQTQGHQGFDARFHAAVEATGCRAVAEICAQSWPEQADCTEAELWAEFVRCWKQSSGHWRTACVKHRYVGAGMSKGRNGTWYGCILAAD